MEGDAAFTTFWDAINGRLLIWYIIVVLRMSRKGSWKCPWSEEEDRALKQLYETTQVNKWSLIAEKLEQFGFGGRTGKQCRER